MLYHLRAWGKGDHCLQALLMPESFQAPASILTTLIYFVSVDVCLCMCIGANASLNMRMKARGQLQMSSSIDLLFFLRKSLSSNLEPAISASLDGQ